jgi:branched-chain amino acid transport system substrate-binding protein
MVRLVSRLLVAAAIVATLPVAATAQQGPIRLGFLTVNTGALAAGGRQMEQGLRQFLKERNDTLAGRKVELIVADTGGNPAGAKTKTQELVERFNVQVIIGPLATFEALAIDDYIHQAQVPLITPTSAASQDAVQRKPNPWLVHAVGTAPQPMHVLGEYAAKKLGFKRIAMIADDFTYGHEGAAGFQRVFEENGGKIVQKLWSPLNVADYGSYIAQIKPDVDAVYAGFAGANGLRFLQQYAEYGLHDKLPVLGNTTAVDEGILQNMGNEALGVYSAGWYAATIDTPDNRKFVDAIRATYKVEAGFYTAGTYVAGMVVEAAAIAVQGRVEDKEAFRAALRKVALANTPMGPIRIDAYATPVLNIYIRKVERRDGRLVNAILETKPEVSQFWTYDPKQFLADPIYSRDWPPAKNLE